jgi:hypothetical protein
VISSFTPWTLPLQPSQFSMQQSDFSDCGSLPARISDNGPGSSTKQPTGNFCQKGCRFECQKHGSCSGDSHYTFELHCDFPPLNDAVPENISSMNSDFFTCLPCG